MNRNIISLFLLYFSAIVNIRAQVLERTIANFKSVYSLAYTTEFKDKDLFSDSIFNQKIKVEISLTENKPYIFKATGEYIEEMYDGSKLIKFNLLDSTYRVLDNTENSVYNYKLLPNIISGLADDLKKHLLVKQQEDSIVNGKSFYQLKITERDSMVNNKRTFRFVTLLIDTKTYLLSYYRSEQQGFIDGTNMFIETFSESYFKDYKVNSKSFSDLSTIEIPTHFVLEKPKKPLPLLVKGTKAPAIELYDSTGNIFNLENQKGKIVLLNFTLNGCPHCIESIEMLNKLYSKYNNSHFVIVTINPFDNKQSIKNNNIRFNVKYPIYTNPINGSRNVDTYQVEGYPTFYLIDKQGNIAKGFSGYYPALEQEFVELINSLKKL